MTGTPSSPSLRLAALGIDGIWTPPPCKDTNAENNMGYTPYD